MKNKNYITVSEYAAIKGISKQAVYKRLNNRLKDFLIIEDNQKYIKIEALTPQEIEKVERVEQPFEQLFEQPLNNPNQPFLIEQIAAKDKQIESLLKQIENLQNQNDKLTDLLKNSQLLLAADKKLMIEQKPKEKEKHFLFWKRKGETK